MTIPKITPAVHHTLLRNKFHATSCRLRGAFGNLFLYKTMRKSWHLARTFAVMQVTCCSLRFHEHEECK